MYGLQLSTNIYQRIEWYALMNCLNYIKKSHFEDVTLRKWMRKFFWWNQFTIIVLEEANRRIDRSWTLRLRNKRAKDALAAHPEMVIKSSRVEGKMAWAFGNNNVHIEIGSGKGQFVKAAWLVKEQILTILELKWESVLA